MIDVTFIRQGASPVLEITAIGTDITNATVYVTLDQGDVQITKSNYKQNDPSVTMRADGNDTDITVILSQEETLWLRPGSARVQLRWIFDDGTADASDMGRIEIGEALLKGVIRHG